MQTLPEFNQNVAILRAPSDLVYDWSGIESLKRVSELRPSP